MIDNRLEYGALDGDGSRSRSFERFVSVGQEEGRDEVKDSDNGDLFQSTFPTRC